MWGPGGRRGVCGCRPAWSCHILLFSPLISADITTPPPAPDTPAAGGAPEQGDHAPFLGTDAARRQAEREYAGVRDEFARRGAALAAAVAALMPGVAVEVRQTPERCVVQAGAVAVSLSRLRGPSPATSRLLVIEWEGTVRCGGPTRQGEFAGARSVGEEVFRAEAEGPDAWRWRAGDGRPAYTSQDLAARCVDRLRRRLDLPAESLATAAPAAPAAPAPHR